MNAPQAQPAPAVQTPARDGDVHAELLDAPWLQLLAAVLIVALAAGLSALWPMGFATPFP